VIAAPLLHDERQAGELKAYSVTWQAFENVDTETLGLLAGIAAAQLSRAGSFADDSGLRDLVTGLGNRRAYEEQLAAECSRARRHGHALTLCLLELDGFDQVIESHGRPAADEILRQVGATLGRLRTEDMPFRTGDRDFAVVLPATTSEHANVPVQRLAAHIASRSFGAVTATFGLADGPLDPTELHSAAEQRLREVKAQQSEDPVRA
jgi:diguanylate cyclase (GGDEF)-like protein